jgi:hypothetical protein
LEAHLKHCDSATETKIVNSALLRNAGEFRRSYESATPFKHVVIESFFDPEFGAALLRDFPRFDPARAMNEFGKIGGKAVNERIRDISPVYSRLDEYLKSGFFLGMMMDLTGISDLLPDPNMFGGGTHENLHGQELDPHIDFNYDPPTKLHRRLNLLVYLNPEWHEEWGGSIELHSDPRQPHANEVKAFLPIFNRAVVFETNERSWHGFPRIELPEDKRHLSRKSLSIYLYTRTRPAHEVVPEHGTFYVQRALPGRYQPGLALAQADIDEIRGLLRRRDQWIQHYQASEIRASAEAGALRERIGALDGRIVALEGMWRVPALGWALQEGAASGFYHDGWVDGRATVSYRAARPLSRVCIDGWLPDYFLNGNTIVLRVAGRTASARVQPGLFTLAAPLAAREGDAFELTIEAELTSSGKRRGDNADERNVAFIMREIAFEAPSAASNVA